MGTINELQEVFREIFGDEIVISNATTADDIDDWDSLTHMQLIVAIEKKYNIKFTIAEIQKAANVGEFIDIIQDKLK